MSLYLESGFLDQNWIAETAKKNGISFIVEIGSRQVGKTYGVNQHVINSGHKFFFMRRTTTEMDFIITDVNNPFRLHGDISVKRASKYTGDIFRNSPESDPEHIGTVLALSTVAKIRGFDASEYTDLIYDEFIPEAHVSKIKNEGDAFLNAVVTITGNRELEGRPPLRVWLLANSNNIDSPILKALNIQKKVEEMKARCQEYAIMKERGIMIILPMSGKIRDKRSKTALFRAIGTDNRFSEMALENKFSYNDETDVKSVNLSEFKLLADVAGVYLYRHKSKRLLYASAHKNGTPKQAYMDTDRDKARFKAELSYVRPLYMSGHMFFESLTVKSAVLDFIF